MHIFGGMDFTAELDAAWEFALAGGAWVTEA
jgi:hypothetical protein